jgi:predicted AlkP superfamily phosphohydrolase/phosphomutase
LHSFPTRKLVIIGLDGADFAITKKLMDEGKLPRLSAIGASGCFSALGSTIPPQTAPGWTSMTTGMNPGKHGIFYFYNFSTSPPTIINSTNTSAPRIWDLVGATGGRSVIVNVPITYPASRISGFLVSGIPPWYVDARSVYPPTLMADLKDRNYEIDAPVSRGLERKPGEFVARLIETEERRVGLFLDLLRRETWSFGMVVMTALDRLQHHLLGEGEEGNVAVERGYAKVDGLVGKIIDSLGPKINCLVVSDHGFNPRPVAFYPNSWLRKEGLLRTKSSVHNRALIAAHNLLDGHLLWAPQTITRRYQGASTIIRTIDAVDLVNSRAFVPGTDGVLVVRSRVDANKITSGLSNLRDDSGKKICEVLAREQVYKGDRLDSAPELLLVPRDDVNIRTDPFSKEIVSTEGSFPRANHGPTGIFLAAGPSIRKTSVKHLSIMDVSPTALRLLGIGPPDYIEGRPLTEMLDEGSQIPLLQLAGGRRLKESFGFSAAEEELILDHLDRLGYL